jgi:hypothetical protein
MDRQEARSVLRERLAGYRRLPFAALAAKVGTEEHEELVGPSGAQYQTEIWFSWDSTPGGTVRVMGAIDDGGWRAFIPLCDSILAAAVD